MHQDYGASVTSHKNLWRVTVGTPSTVGLCSVRTYIGRISLTSWTRVSTPWQKSYPWYLWLNINCPAGPWFPMSQNVLQRGLKKQIAGMVTLLIWTRWHRPIHLCLLFDVLEWAEHRDGLYYWHLVWWIKHQCRFEKNWIFFNTSRNGYGSQDLLQSETLQNFFQGSQLFKIVSCILLETQWSFCNCLTNPDSYYTVDWPTLVFLSLLPVFLNVLVRFSTEKPRVCVFVCVVPVLHHEESTVTKNDISAVKWYTASGQQQ